MKFDGIAEVCETKSETEQVYISNFGLIKKMLNSPYVDGTVIFEDDKMSEVDGSVYNQGIDDVAMNIQEAVSSLEEKIHQTNEVAPTSAVVQEPSKSVENIEGVDNGSNIGE